MDEAREGAAAAPWVVIKELIRIRGHPTHAEAKAIRRALSPCYDRDY